MGITVGVSLIICITVEQQGWADVYGSYIYIYIYIYRALRHTIKYLEFLHLEDIEDGAFGSKQMTD